ncbi:hypothetical protein [Candidatus Palauibacter sp.]|uniref:hypothetical protein n=1 Tax=Candidatus Palauibacter sp. TaxID=3101350 RepID=UPI003B5C6BD7
MGFALERLGFDPRGARVLLLGAGGAARGAVHALLEGGASSVEVLNRTAARAHALRAAVGGEALRVVETPDPGAAYDLVLNATSLGLSASDPLPLALDRGRFALACDMVYSAGETPWVRHARSLGIRARDGLEMLVGQAALSLKCWFPGRAPPVEAMRAAAVEALDTRAR